MAIAARAPRRARISARSGSSTKATFRLDDAVLAAVRECVEAGVASSQTAFVEAAIREYLREIRKRELEAAYAAAAEDPAFMARMESTTEAFEATGDDGLS